jgi:hypothetical protein
MRRSLAASLALIGALALVAPSGLAYAQPPKSWTEYRIARSKAEAASPEEQIRIWSDYLARFPDSAYRERVLIEIDAATRALWGEGSPYSRRPSPPAADVTADDEAALALAGGEESPRPEAPPALRPRDPASGRPYSRKRPMTAALLAWGATGGGLMIAQSLAVSGDARGDDAAVTAAALIGIGAMVLGPSAGHVYSGEREHARRFTLYRLVTGAATVGFAAAGLSGAADEDTSLLLATISGATFMGLVGYDLIDSFFTAQRAEGRPAGRRFMVAPAAVPSAQGKTSLGLGLAGSF